MPVHVYRELKPTPEAEAIYRRWLARLNDEFTRHTKPEIRSQIVRDELIQLYLGRPHGGPAKATLNNELAIHTLTESLAPPHTSPPSRRTTATAPPSSTPSASRSSGSGRCSTAPPSASTTGSASA